MKISYTPSLTFNENLLRYWSERDKTPTMQKVFLVMWLFSIPDEFRNDVWQSVINSHAL